MIKGFITCLLMVFVLTVCGQKKDVMNVAIFIHEGVELFDFAGPGEAFVAAHYQSYTHEFNVYTVASTKEEITSQTFLKVIPNYSFEDCPEPDIIVLPGGATGIPLGDPKVIEWIKKSNETADITLSVCTGAFLLGKAGLLEGLKATTHWGSIDALRNQYPNTVVLEETKFIDNGKIVTSGGVSSGTEGSLHVISRIAGKPAAERVARYMEYSNWDNRKGLVEYENNLISSIKSQGLFNALKNNNQEVYYGELMNLGIEYLEANKLNEAKEVFSYLKDEFPSSESYEYYGKVLKANGKDVPLTQSEITDLIHSGEVSKAARLYTSQKSQHPDWIIFSEGSLFHMAHRLADSDRLEDAIQVMKLVTVEYPKSSRAWHGLGQGYLELGDDKRAKKYFKKSLELNPDNERVKEQLAQLQ